MAKLNFQLPLPQASVSHGPSENLIWCLSNISYYYQCWKQLCCLMFLWKPLCLFFQDSLINKFDLLMINIFFFKMEIFYNIVNIFTVTFDQLNATLLTKSIIFFKNKSYWPQTLKYSVIHKLCDSLNLWYFLEHSRINYHTLSLWKRADCTVCISFVFHRRKYAIKLWEILNF